MAGELTIGELMVKLDRSLICDPWKTNDLDKRPVHVKTVMTKWFLMMSEEIGVKNKFERVACCLMAISLVESFLTKCKFNHKLDGCLLPAACLHIAMKNKAEGIFYYDDLLNPDKRVTQSTLIEIERKLFNECFEHIHQMTADSLVYHILTQYYDVKVDPIAFGEEIYDLFIETLVLDECNGQSQTKIGVELLKKYLNVKKLELTEPARQYLLSIHAI